MEAEARWTRLALYRQEAGQCTRCRELGLLYRHEDGRWAYPLFHEEAECPSGVLVVAEAPNKDDTFNANKAKLTIDPETDPSGRFALELFDSVGLGPEDFLATNAVLCLPAEQAGKHPVKAQQLDQCHPWLERLIHDLDPGVVVTLGGLALDAVGRIDRHGLTLRTGVGRMHPWFGRQLLPLYHPSLLGRVTRKPEQQMQDISILKQYLDSIGWKSRPPRET